MEKRIVSCNVGTAYVSFESEFSMKFRELNGIIYTE